MLSPETIQTEIEAFENSQIISFTNKVLKDGQLLEPGFSILTYDFPSKTFGDVNLPIPFPEILNSPNGKEQLFNTVMPKLFDFFTANFKQIISVCVCTEIWLRMVNLEGVKDTAWKDGKNGIKMPDGANKQPKEEALMLNFETENFSKSIYWLMKGTPNKRTLTEKIELDTRKEGVKSSGLIPEMFRRYNRMKQN